MRLLVDTHTLIWAVDQPGNIGAAARAEVENPANELLVSAATIWEISIKVGLGKLSLALSYQQWMRQVMGDLNALLLPITIDFAAAQSTLP